MFTRHPDLIASPFVLWETMHGEAHLVLEVNMRGGEDSALRHAAPRWVEISGPSGLMMCLVRTMAVFRLNYGCV